MHILWSGGIDTTAVVVGFLRTAKPEDWATKLSVPCDIASDVDTVSIVAQPVVFCGA